MKGFGKAAGSHQNATLESMAFCSCLTAATAFYYVTATVPGTYTFTVENWTNNGWGFHDVDRTEESGLVRIGTDGSRMTRINHYEYKKWLVPRESWTYDLLYRASEQSSYVIDPKLHKIGIVPCIDRFSGVKCSPVPQPAADDNKCSQTASEKMKGAEFVGFGVTAGLSTARYRHATGLIRWSPTRPLERYTYEVAFAPELGCAIVEALHTTYNSMSIPTIYTHFVTRSFKRDAPGAEAFLLPQGYEMLSNFLPAPFQGPVE